MAPSFEQLFASEHERVFAVKVEHLFDSDCYGDKHLFDPRPQEPRMTPPRTDATHGELDPLPVSASLQTAALLGAPVDVLEGNGHFPWLEDPGCIRRSLQRLLDQPIEDHSDPTSSDE